MAWETEVHKELTQPNIGLEPSRNVLPCHRVPETLGSSRTLGRYSSPPACRKYIVHTLEVGMQDLQFEWGPPTATANLRKHGIAFEEAQTVFSDELALLIDDPDRSAEETRFVLLGLSAASRLLAGVHAYPATPDTIRIISARKATKAERTTYVKRHPR